MDIKEYYDKICHCKNPAIIFESLLVKDDKENQLAKLKKEYLYFMREFHPDRHSGSDTITKYLAGQISSIVNEMYVLAVDTIKNGSKSSIINDYPTLATIETKNGIYEIFEHIVEGEYANIYRARYGSNIVIIKVVHNLANNRFMRNEIKVIKLLKHKSLPVYIDSFKTSDNTVGIIMSEIDGYDFPEVVESGHIQEIHACWILERLLSVLGYIHINKILHGNIKPSNIMVRPRDHNAFLIDFMFSLVEPMNTEEKIKVYSEEFSHPDVLRKVAPRPEHDLYSIGKSMFYLMGSAKMSTSFKKFLTGFVNGNATDAWAKHKELRALRKSLGHKGFITLEI